MVEILIKQRKARLFALLGLIKILKSTQNMKQTHEKIQTSEKCYE